MECLSKSLDAGDYSISGIEHLVVVERKSLADFYGCLTGGGRERFENCLHRLAAIRYPLVILEANTDDLFRRFTYVAAGGVPMQSEVEPLVAQNSVLSWQGRFRIPILPCGDRSGGARMTLQHLDLIWRMHRKGFAGDWAGLD